MVSKKMEGSRNATSNDSTQGAVMSDDVNFEFAFNSRTFSDRILKVEVADDPPSKDLDSKDDQIPNLKMECEKTTNNNTEPGSAAAAYSSKILLGVESLHASSVTLTAKRNFLFKLFSNGTQKIKFFFKLFSNGTQENNDNELGSAAAADSSENILRVESVHVSSAILAAKSKFFFKLFSNGMQESDQHHVTVRVSLSEETTFMELIRFMYSGKLSSISPPFLLGVLTIADKFEVPTCMNHCVRQAMALPMTTESALVYLDLPHALSMVSTVDPLVNAAKEFIGNKYKRIIDVSMDELLTLSLTAMEAIFGRDDLEIQQEDMVYDILVEWACARYPKPEELWDVFNHRLVPLVRFAHVSYERLGQLLVSTDLNGDLASKLIAVAIIYKAECPLRQRELQAADGWLAERAYSWIPFKMVELESQFPHCIIYMDLKKDKLAKLFPSGEIPTQYICLGGEGFYLSGNCNLDQQQPNGAHCFGFYLHSVQEEDREKLTVAYEFAAWSISLDMFELKENGVFNLNRGTGLGFRSLFGVPAFMAEDSPYFVDGILHMRAQLINTTPWQPR